MTKEHFKNVYIHARVSCDLATAAKLYAEENDRTLSWVIRKALEEFLQKKGYPVPSS